MRRVLWSAAATRDLDEVRSHYGEDVAQRLINRIVLATDWLLDWPHAGSEVATSGWRKWKPTRSIHILIYRPVEGGIEVNRVRHERENWLADL